MSWINPWWQKGSPGEVETYCPAYLHEALRELHYGDELYAAAILARGLWAEQAEHDLRYEFSFWMPPTFTPPKETAPPPLQIGERGG